MQKPFPGYAEIICGETTYQVKEVILIRDRDRTLERISHETAQAETVLIRLDAEEKIARMNGRIAEGYEYLCLFLTDGRALYPVKPEHLVVAEKLAQEVCDEIARQTPPPTVN